MYGSMPLPYNLRRIKESLEKDLNSDYGERCTIFRVPTNIRETNRSLYEPRVVSIGPYYHGCPLLEAMNFHKLRFLKLLLSRSESHSLEAYLEAVDSVTNDAFKSYSVEPKLSRDDFVRMLLLDGCFILGLVCKSVKAGADVLTESWGLTWILSDLLLMENQIPFFVIERLHQTCKKRLELTNIERDAFLNVFANFLIGQGEQSTILLQNWPKVNNLLDLYHHSLLLPLKADSDNWADRLRPLKPGSDERSSERLPRQMPSATELHEAGVQFKRMMSPKTLFDVKFAQGVLEIPLLQIDSKKKIELANLVALEKYKSFGGQVATSYVAMMDGLINTADDVAILQRAGVLQNKLSSHQEAAVFLNELGDSLLLETLNPHFAKILKDVQLYSDSRWNQNLARLYEDYFQSPWTVISFLTGVTFLGLTALQTVYTVYSYYHQH